MELFVAAHSKRRLNYVCHDGVARVVSQQVVPSRDFAYRYIIG